MKNARKITAVLMIFVLVLLSLNLFVLPVRAEEDEPVLGVSKEPESGLHVNSYLGYISDGATWPNEYEAEVFRFLSMVDPDWSPEQKLIFLHDFLVTDCDYDYENKADGQYGVLIDGYGVCADYASTFRELAGRMGIQVKRIVSDSMNHEWNLAEIDGEWFYIDCTWDDGVYSDANRDPHYKMFCDHQFFLESEEAFRHGATDWRSINPDDSGEKVYGKYHNTTYDYACWYDSFSPVIVTDSGFLILKSNGKIYSCDSKGRNETLVASVPDYSKFGTMVSVGDTVFVSNADTIYRVNISSGQFTQIYTLSQNEKDSYGTIYGIEPEGTKLRYDLGTTPGKKGYTKSGCLDLEQIIGKEIKGSSLNENALTFYEAGTTFQLKLTDYNGKQVSADSWVSSDPSVATVSSGGVVTAVGYGKTLITARKDGKKYRCTVAFDTTWQNDYRYGVWEDIYHPSEYIYLDQHLGTGLEANMVIPSYAYVGGERYTTSVRSSVFSGGISGRVRTGTNLFPENSVIQTITLEKGTCVAKDFYGKLQACENLTAFDFGGADLSSCGRMNGFFYNCKKLEFVNLSGCRMENSIGTVELLKNAPAVTRILTPASIREGLSIPLSTALCVKNADGTYGNDRITDLADAPRNAELGPLPDTTWQNDYVYHIAAEYYYSGNYLCLDKYIGTNENIYIPAKAIVDGIEYPVCIRGAEENGDGSFRALSLFREKQTIKSFAAQEGVLITSYYSYYLFHSCTELKEVNLEGIDFSQTRTLYMPFTYCYSLEKVSFKGCNLGKLSYVYYFFEGCNNLKEIITPDAIADGITIPLPVTMYVKNEDGTTGETGYTTLESAPRGCTLTSEKNLPHQHQLTHTVAKNPTCTTAGNSEYWYCEGCDSYYSDERATTEIKKNSWIIAALGHKWDDGVVTKEPTEEEEGIKTFTCERCKATYTESIQKKEPVTPTVSVTEIFDDVKEGAWYVSAVQFAYDSGIMTGKSKTKFAPNVKLSRQELTQIIYTNEGKPALTATDNPFADVKEGAWYKNSVLWAKEKGIVSGKSDTRFGIGQNITREELALMLYRYAQYKNLDVSVKDSTDLSGFTDTEKVSGWALEAVKWAVERGIISGKGSESDGFRIDPKQGASRAECAAMMKKFAELSDTALQFVLEEEEPLALPEDEIEDVSIPVEEIEDAIDDEDVIPEDEDIVDEEDVIPETEESIVLEEEKEE